MWQEFKTFILRGSVVDMAVGIIIGLAFGAIVNSLVRDVIMPPVGYITGGVDFTNLYMVMKAGTPAPPYPSLADAQKAGAITINYGTFINTVIVFLIVAAVLFLLIRMVNRMRARIEPPKPVELSTKDCPYCLSAIPLKAVRCPHCTSQLETAK